MEESIIQMYDLTGKVAIVTGASQGLGISFARGLTKAGANVVLAARSLNKLQKIARDLGQYSHRIMPIRVDVTKPKDVDNLVKQVTSSFGKIDILVNNAGIATVVEAENMSLTEWQQVIDTNVTGLFLCAQASGRQMLSQGYGKIINIASQYGFVAASYVPQVSYVTSKSAVLGLTRELAVEWASRGLHVVALALGFFRSAQTVWAFEKNQGLSKKLLARIPMGRMGKLEELEATVVFLASAASDYMNGQALILDGGFLSW